MENLLDPNTRQRLVERVQEVVNAGHTEATREVVEPIVEAYYFDSSIFMEADVTKLTKQWAFSDKRRYAEAFGVTLDLEWTDADFQAYEWEKLDSAYDTLERKIGSSVHGSGTIANAFKSEVKLEFHNMLYGQLRDDAFAKNYINDLLTELEGTEEGDLIEVKGRYLEDRIEHSLTIENTRENRNKIAELKKYIEEQNRRRAIVGTRLMFVTTDSSNVRPEN